MTDDTIFIIQIEGLADGRPSPHDGRYLKEYIPRPLELLSDASPVTDDMRVMDASIIRSTADPHEARQFASFADAAECWKTSVGMRPDGRPNRPLTAFTCQFRLLRAVLAEQKNA